LVGRHAVRIVDMPMTADEVIVDYSKTMQINVMENDPSLLFLTGYSRTVQGFAAYSEDVNLISSRVTAGQTTYPLDSGILKVVSGGVEFTPTTLLEKVERVHCVVKYTKGTNSFYVYEELRIVPATIMYYESDFAGIVDTESHKDFVFIDFGPDDTTTWDWSKRVTVTKDTENGLLKGDITGGDPFVSMENGTKQLNYVTKPGDVIVMRAKTTRTSEGGNSTGYEVFLSFADTTTQSGWEGLRDTSHEQGTGRFEILTLPIPDEMIGRKLEEFRFDPFHNADGNKVLGTYELDYVYIGQPATAPAEDYLFFDFDNGTDDQLRYKQEQYGGFNYDEANWAVGASNGYSIDNTNGTLTVNVSSNTSYNGPYLSVTNTNGTYPWSSGKAYAPLSYLASGNETMQLRFKITDCNVAGGTDATVYVVSHSTRGSTDRYVGGSLIAKDFTIVDNEYITLSIPMSHYFQEGDIIKTIGLWFVGLTTSGGGKIEIDYIYVGKEADYNKVMIHDRSAKTNTMGNASSDNYL